MSYSNFRLKVNLDITDDVNINRTSRSKYKLKFFNVFLKVLDVLVYFREVKLC